MEEKTITQRLDELIHWERLFEMLSLERAEPFLGELGFRLSDASSMRTIARGFVEQAEKNNINLSDADAEAKIEKEKQWIQTALDEMAEVLGDQMTRDIQERGLDQFPLRYKELYYWSRLLKWLAGLGGREYPPQHPAIEPGKVDVLIRALRENFGDESELERRLEKADLLPKSTWDEHIYQVYEGEPLSTLSSLIGDYRIQQTWKFINTLLTRDEIDALVQWAKSQAPQLNIKSEKINLPF